MPRAVSRYKQVRVTLTEEQCHGHPQLRNITLRVMVKPLEADWNMRHTVLHQVERGLPPLDSLDAVYETILEFLASPSLPESPSD